MQRNLQFFNPDSDLALASGDLNYITPRSARKMGEDLSVLPCWYSPKDTAILIGTKDSLKNWDSWHPAHDFFAFDEIKAHPELFPAPWGWNPMLIRFLRKMGVSESALPDVGQMERLRRLSHRSSSIRLLHSLALPFPVCGAPEELFSEEAVSAYINNQPFCLLKEPLSGSGKGLRWCKGEYTEVLQRWSRRAIKEQGSIIAEPIYNKVKDFAMEFHVKADGSVSFAGYSLFMTDEWGAYQGNLLASDAEIEARLSCFVPLEQLAAIKEQLLQQLPLLLQGNYAGYLGVDMMICKSGSAPEYLIHPCVEMNLRMNMGVVARLLYDNHVFPDSEGTFRIDYHKDSAELMRWHKEMMQTYPLQMEGERVKSGYLPLVPLTGDNSYVAWILASSPSPALKPFVNRH